MQFVLLKALGAYWSVTKSILKYSLIYCLLWIVLLWLFKGGIIKGLRRSSTLCNVVEDCRPLSTVLKIKYLEFLAKVSNFSYLYSFEILFCSHRRQRKVFIGFGGIGIFIRLLMKSIILKLELNKNHVSFRPNVYFFKYIFIRVLQIRQGWHPSPDCPLMWHDHRVLSSWHGSQGLTESLQVF